MALGTDEQALLGALIEDLEAHLRWRQRSGITRLPPPRPPASTEGATQPSEAPEAAPPEVPPPVSPAAAPAAAPATGAAGLEAVRAELGDCTRCKLHGGRTHLVFGVGNPEAELVFVGEGPGGEEDKQGVPFVGRAGELLTKMIAAMGYGRDDVYICNVVKCRPPGNRDPEPDEVAACKPFLDAQLGAIRPKVIVGLGKFAAQFLLGDPEARITRVRGRWGDYRGVAVMPTFHPAYLLRNPAAKREAWADLQEVMRRLGRPVGGS